MNYRDIIRNESTKISQNIPGSVTGETVTIQIRRTSDEYYWNFTSEAWQSTATSGTMDFDYSEFWTASFTPSTNNDNHNVTITYGTVIYSQVLVSRGMASQVATTSETLTTTAKVKAFIKKSDTDDDDLIDMIVQNASAEIEDYCQRTFNDTTHTEYYNGDGSRTLVVGNYPIISITGIWDDLDYEWADADEIDSDDIVFQANSDDAKAGIIKLVASFFSKWTGNIKITYTAGYTSIPYDLERACNMLVVYDYIMGSGVLVNRIASELDVSNFRDKAYEIIDRYKRWR